jgi:hypothetical protein
MPDDAPATPLSSRDLIFRALRLSGPALVFVAAAALAPICVAAPLAVAVALVILAVQWRRGQSVRPSLIGLAITLACVAVVALTGEARDFFLLPMTIPFVAIAVCVWSIVVSRPLAGILINPLARGPRDWVSQPAVRRVYMISTWVCVAINVFNGGAQILAYLAGSPAILAALHTFTGPVFGLVMIATAAQARRVMGSTATARA